MSSIMKKHGYISNKDRNKNIKKLDRGYGGRKLVIIVAAITGLLLSIWMILGILGQGGIIKTEAMAFIKEDGKTPTAWGYFTIALLAIEIVFAALAILFTFGIMSARDAAHISVKISRTALSGKKSSGSAAKDVRRRVTTQ